MVILVIPYNAIGGAEKVHLEIIRAIRPYVRLLIVFTSTGGNTISEEFRKYPYVNLRGSKLIAAFYAIAIVFLSRILKLTLFGCNNRFFYNLLPFVGKKTRTIDLTHAFTNCDEGIEVYSKKYIKYIKHRVLINHKTLEDYRQQYLLDGIDTKLIDRFQVIPNGIYIKPFDEAMINDRFSNFTIGYVGRYSSEKRPDIFLALSRIQYNFNCNAKIICDYFGASESDYPAITKVVGINDPEIIRGEMSTISVLLITSDREGFPLSIMEAMEQGIPVISTNVGSISEHLISGFNGFIAEPGMSDESFIDFSKEKIEEMAQNKTLYYALSLNAREYAQNHFDVNCMHQAYKALLIENSIKDATQ